MTRDEARATQLEGAASLTSSQLRPIERRVLRLLEQGVDLAEVGRRFGRSSDHISRVVRLARLPGRDSIPAGGGLRPIERRILRWRAEGATHADIAGRFRRSPSSTERIEGYAHYKLTNLPR